MALIAMGVLSGPAPVTFTLEGRIELIATMARNNKTGLPDHQLVSVLLTPTKPFEYSRLLAMGPVIPLDLHPNDINTGSGLVELQVEFDSSFARPRAEHVSEIGATDRARTSPLPTRPPGPHPVSVVAIKALPEKDAAIAARKLKKRQRRHLSNGYRALLVIVVGINSPFVDIKTTQHCATEESLRRELWGHPTDTDAKDSLRSGWLAASYGQLDFKPNLGKLVWGVQISTPQANVDSCIMRDHAAKAYMTATGLDATYWPDARFDAVLCDTGYTDYTQKDSAEACHMACACDPGCSYVSVMKEPRSSRDYFRCYLHDSKPELSSCINSGFNTGNLVGTFEVPASSPAGAKITLTEFCSVSQTYCDI